ncbi:hypothetical protein HKCCE3408_16860 [Rhodobacterales bacterium HKCCE3408]|nr:hypothetical protein [Rhodobacterales bacterium HKCCE3408]
MSIRMVASLGAVALALAGCAQPQPQVTRATPLYSKAGEALCVPDDLYDPNQTYNRPVCEEICREDPVAGANVAICPPYYEDRQRGGGGGNNTGGRTPPPNPNAPRGAAAGP